MTSHWKAKKSFFFPQITIWGLKYWVSASTESHLLLLYLFFLQLVGWEVSYTCVHCLMIHLCVLGNQNSFSKWLLLLKALCNLPLFHPLRHSLVYWWRWATLPGAGPTIGTNVAFSVSSKDTWTYGRGSNCQPRWGDFSQPAWTYLRSFCLI